ncbi:MAG: IclR family transcriptional regulator [Nitratireductor sp.]|nr:IclR family transcriptional regulator [Nitratireductor sp.]
MPRISGETTDGIQSVVLALRVIEHLAQSRRPIGVTSLANDLGTTKSRIYRHLQTLVQQGYIVRSEETERYKVGSRLISLGRQVSENNSLVNAAHYPMRELCETLGHSCVLSQIEEEGARVLLTVPGKSSIEIGVKPGSLLKFNNSAQGKIVAAFSPQAKIERILARPLERTTPNTITDPAKLREHLAMIRERGWATAANESAIGLNTLAFPLFDEMGAVVGSVAIVDLVQFIEAQPSAEQISETARTARRIWQNLGYAG